MRKLIVVVAAVLVGCNGEEPQTREEIILSLSPDVTAGKDGYDVTCGVCHGDAGVGNAVGPALVGLDAGTVVGAVLAPPSGMTDFSTLPDQEIADIAGYIESL